ncbi:hypothetical protein AWB73_01122 [Caballeronia turbans]|nr:hypothetical protein AWB73_01122 [Caballeronia turbans]
MTECDELARGMRDDFLDWIRAEDRELTHYPARRFVTAQMPDETMTVRESVAISLFATARARAGSHYAAEDRGDGDSPMAGI